MRVLLLSTASEICHEPDYSCYNSSWYGTKKTIHSGHPFAVQRRSARVFFRLGSYCGIKPIEQAQDSDSSDYEGENRNKANCFFVFYSSYFVSCSVVLLSIMTRRYCEAAFW